MSRALLLLALPLLLGAAPVTTVEPPRPLLGHPCTVTIPLPGPETTLAGLPSLGSFELLLPPQREVATLRLLLLPLRPGDQEIPSLTLQDGTRLVATLPLTVTVVDDLPAKLTPAPLLRTAGISHPGSWQWLTLALLPLVAIGLWWLRRRRLRPLPPTPDEELAVLTRQLRALSPEQDTVSALLQRIEELRFAPTPVSCETQQQLLAEGRTLLKGGG